MSKYRFKLFALLFPAYSKEYLRLQRENYKLRYTVPIIDIEIERKLREIAHNTLISLYYPNEEDVIR